VSSFPDKVKSVLLQGSEVESGLVEGRYYITLDSPNKPYSEIGEEKERILLLLQRQIKESLRIKFDLVSVFRAPRDLESFDIRQVKNEVVEAAAIVMTGRVTNLVSSVSVTAAFEGAFNNRKWFTNDLQVKVNHHDSCMMFTSNDGIYGLPKSITVKVPSPPTTLFQKFIDALLETIISKIDYKVRRGGVLNQYLFKYINRMTGDAALYSVKNELEKMDRLLGSEFFTERMNQILDSVKQTKQEELRKELHRVANAHGMKFMDLQEIMKTEADLLLIESVQSL
jgi:hypothetical protein